MLYLERFTGNAGATICCSGGSRANYLSTQVKYTIYQQYDCRVWWDCRWDVR